MTDDEHAQLLALRKRLAARSSEAHAKCRFYEAAIWRAKANGVAQVIAKFKSETQRRLRIETAREKRRLAKKRKAVTR